MPTKVKVSLDELLSKRQGNIVSTPRGDALVKAFKSPPSWDPDARTAKFVMTSESVDRYGDIVRQAGLDTERFMENPQALLFHDSRNWPIGTWSDITKMLSGRPKRTEGLLNFLPAGADPDADRAAVHVEHKTIRTVSIGFLPKDWEAITDEDTGYWTGYDITASELIECSLVPIPAQPDALVKDAGGDPQMLKFLIEDVLDNYSRTPEGLIVPRSEYEKLYNVTIEKIGKPATPKDPAQLELTIGERAAGEPTATIKAGGEKVELSAVELSADQINIIVPTGESVDVALRSVTAEDVLPFLANAVEGDQIILVRDAEETDPFVGSDGVWRTFKEGEAVRIEIKRGDGIVDQLPLEAKLAAEAMAAIAARQKEVTKATPAPVVASEEPARQKISEVTVEIKADTKQLEEDVTRVSGLLDGLFAKIGKMMGLKKGDDAERVEPVIEVPAPMPTPEAIALVKGKALSVRSRISSKNLI